jgi:hypothetical protein
MTESQVPRCVPVLVSGGFLFFLGTISPRGERVGLTMRGWTTL